MGQAPGSQEKRSAIWPAVLAAAALDSLAAGAWAVARPDDLFALIRLTPPRDAFLWPVLGMFSLAYGVCLLVAAARPRDLAGLAWLPALGRALACGVWLWLLGTDRVQAAPGPLGLLLAHDAGWLAVLLAFLYARRRG
jgi:hypothetical protein